MFIADITMESISFRGVPLYNDENNLVFVSEIPFYIDGVVESGEILSIPKEMVKSYKPLYRIHTFERFSILHILDNKQRYFWKTTIVKMFEARGIKMTLFLQRFNIEQLLVFVDLWEAGDIIVEDDVIFHHDEEQGLIKMEVDIEEDTEVFMDILSRLVATTKEKERNMEQVFIQLKNRLHA